ncbi:MAG: GntR family transcriptional regulator [SAR324 cluster bacterium]|uniref:GntR family transcriptional regulator n=1 Tax=SAR324 cluster bacterium TaxID=2024889 RepID=A0A2A4SXM5_9DELT|nr:MAG: GntR family transcriptional regulator [SAR324 cluster bacterium]
MEFKKKQAIYLQIGDLICDKIITREWVQDEKIPSVREMAVQVEVNPNTVMRSYAYLQDQGIIYNKRGIGYFVSEESLGHIRGLKKKKFIQQELPQLFKTMEILQVPFDELAEYYEAFQNNREL